MALINTILKEAGGRFENAAGAIDSKANMFAGSSGNALSDKLGGGENNNPIAEQEENKEETAETPTETSTETETTDTDISDTEKPSSDERLKDTYSAYKTNSSTLKGKTKNLDLDPKSSKPVTSNGGGNAGMMKMFSGMMGGSGEGGEGAGDMGADAGDMGDMAEAAEGADSSDTRLKNIFGENEDAIKCFAKINAIKFVYNEKAHELAPNGEHQVDYDPHYGVKAQELAENPLTASTVEKDEHGYLCVNTEELTMANSAVISEICKRLEIIEKVLGIEVKE